MGAEVETRRVRRRDRPEFAVVALAFLVVIVAASAIGSHYVPGAARSQAARSGASPSADPHVVRWFVSLEAQTPEMLAAEQTFAERFNSTNTDGTVLVVEALPPGSSQADALDRLSLETAVGDAPDIVGPVTQGSLYRLGGSLLDLGPQIESHNLDLTMYDPPLVTALQMPAGLGFSAQAQVGIPYAVDPGFLFYNKDLFQAAGLPPLPTKVGDTYMGKNWDWDELAAVAAQLTRDTAGRTAMDPDFGSDPIDQFGIDFPGVDARTMASTFGSGSFVASDGLTIQVPSVWADGLSWYYNAMWASHIAPPETYADGIATTFSAATSISSGFLAMALSFPSKIPTYTAGGKASFIGWGMAVLPSWRGVTTSPEELSTFSILSASTNQSRAFSAMLAIEADSPLRETFGGMPANPSLRAAWFAAKERDLALIFPGNEVDWSVLETMDSHRADPSPAADLPNYTASVGDISDWFENLRSNSTVDMNTELAKLLTILQIDANESGTQLNQ
jgi:multiple sugar transport system substrate-binding protein